MARRRQVLAAAVALRRRKERPPEPRAAPVWRPQPRVVPAAPLQAPPDMGWRDDFEGTARSVEELAARTAAAESAVRTVSRLLREGAGANDEAIAALAKRLDDALGQLATVGARVEGAHARIEAALQSMAGHVAPVLVKLEAHRADLEQAKSSLRKEADEVVAGLRGELMGSLSAKVTEVQTALGAELQAAREVAGNAAAWGRHAVDEASKALARPIPDALVDLVPDGDVLHARYASGSQKDIELPRRALLGGGGRASSRQQFNMNPLVVTKDANFTIPTGHPRSHIVLASAAATITLPDAAQEKDRRHEVKRTGTGLVTVAAPGSQTIDGLSSISLDTIYDAVEVISDGAAWHIL